MKLFDRLRSWLNAPIVEAVKSSAEQHYCILAAIEERQNTAISHQQACHTNMIEAFIKLAGACESLERALVDRMDVIEGRLDELKPKEQADSKPVGGHRPWTQRRDARWDSHFKVDELVTKLGKVANG